MSVCVISAEGKPLMPTSDYRCRHLLKSGKVVIHQHRPFTIRLTRTISEGYQKGPRYGMDSLRKAIFYRDGYKCQVCGKTAKKGAILRVHHMGYRNGDHSNRSGNLITVCTKCHTAANHKPGGKLYDLRARTKPMKGAAFMNAVRRQMVGELKERHPEIDWHVTYGAATQEARRVRSLAKSHANDAYAMGRFHPAHRTPFAHYRKLRRNSRVLEKFYDAKYIDIRNGKQRTGSELSCGRTNRSEPRVSERSLQMYRGQKTRKGRRSIRRSHYPFRPGDTVITEAGKHRVKGVHCHGTRVVLDNGSSVAVNKIRKIIHAGGYVRIE